MNAALIIYALGYLVTAIFVAYIGIRRSKIAFEDAVLIGFSAMLLALFWPFFLLWALIVNVAFIIRKVHP